MGKKGAKFCSGFHLTMATRFLTLGVATIISCLLVSMAMYQFRQAKDVANTVSSKMSGFARLISEEELAGYDGMLLKGSDVVNFYRRFFLAGSSEFDMVVIQDGKNTKISKENGLAQLIETGGAAFLKAGETYFCRVVRNKNFVISKVEFERCQDMQVYRG